MNDPYNRKTNGRPAKFWAGFVVRFQSWTRALATLGVVLSCVMFDDVVSAQTEPTIDLQRLRQQRPSFLVRAEVDRPTRQYGEGDLLTVKVISEADAFVYVLYEQADGKLFQIFPNSRQPDNRVPAHQEVQIPARDNLFRWRVGPPFGKETVKVIATAQPVKALSNPGFKTKEFNPLPRSVLKGVALELDPDETVAVSPSASDPAGNNRPDPVRPVPNPAAAPVAWAEASVEITTAKTELPPVPPRRVGVFFGVAQYKFAQYAEAGSGKSPNIPTPDTNAKVMEKTMKGVGRLDETRSFTNQAVTRQNLEATICQWLPENTRPGDTVVIYYSGHGSQVNDDNGDEVDHLDEFLIPYDFLGPSEVAGMMKLEKSGKLSADDIRLLAEARQLIAQVGQQNAAEIMTRKTGVTDDLFGHWLQRLDGRQVVVILDTCHSGGFSNNEKSLNPEDKVGDFDFLDRELTRLKDIGQPNTALLSSSATSEVSYVRQERDLGVMTYYLVESLKTHVGPLPLKDAYSECVHGVAGYFQRRPKIKPQHPKLYDIPNSAYLKP